MVSVIVGVSSVSNSHTLSEKIDIEYYIGEIIHTSNVKCVSLKWLKILNNLKLKAIRIHQFYSFYL